MDLRKLKTDRPGIHEFKRNHANQFRVCLVWFRGSIALLLLLLVLAVTRSLAQEATASPSPAPADQNLKVPLVAPEYRAKQSPLPELERVGVDMDQQQPLSLREALKMALDNNKDIEVARENVKLAEFDLLGAHGAYEPRLNAQSYYERVKTPTASFLSGGANGAVTTSDYTGTFRFEGLSPKGGGTYRLDFSSIRSVTNNQFAALNPQYPTALTFTFAQP